jgi:hypothetical protein
VQVRSHAQKFLVQCDRLASSQRTEVDSSDGGSSGGALEALADLGGAALRRDEKRGRNDLTALIGDLPPSAKPYSFGSETDQAAAEAIGRRTARAARAEAAEPPMGGLDGGPSLLSGPSALDSAWGTRSSDSTLGGSTYGGPSSWPTMSTSSSEDGGHNGQRQQQQGGGMRRPLPAGYGMMPVPPAESYMSHQQARGGAAYGAQHGQQQQQGWGGGGSQHQHLPSHGSDPLGGVGELPSVYGAPSGGQRNRASKEEANDAGMDGGEQDSADAAALAQAMAQAQWLAVAAQHQAAKVLAMQAVVAQRQASKLASAGYGSSAPSQSMFDYNGQGGMPASYYATTRPRHNGSTGSGQGPSAGGK